MNIITKWLNARSAAKAEAEHERAKRIRDRLDDYQHHVTKLEGIMLNTHCALERGNCRRDCIHFQPGRALMIEDFDGSPLFFADEPLCKLWAKR